MFGPGKDQELFIANLQQAIGRVQELNARTDPGDWVFAGSFRGRPVRVAITGSKGTFSGVKYLAPMPGPVRLHIEGHYATYSHAAVVPTGDPEFDRHYKVHGLPPEVVLAALDAPMRRWYLDTYGDKTPQTDTEHGWLSVYKTCRKTLDTFDLPAEDVPTAAEITHFLEVVVGLADRISQGYEARKAAIAQSHGAAAAEQWHASYVGTMLDADRRRKQRRLILLGVVAAIAVVPIAIVALFIVAAMIGTCTAGVTR